jgi:SNF2 family DNA or RNA helicase
MRDMMKHQRHALRFVRACQFQAGLFMAPGTGKTLVAIRGALKIEGPKLVVCRRDDFLTWRLELEMEGIDPATIAYIDEGPRTEKVGEDSFGNSIRRQLPYEFPEGFTWLIVTYDLCKNETINDWIREYPFEMVIADELHSIKRWASERTRQVYYGTRHIPYRIGMTGTPITNEVLDVWSECRFIDHGKTFGTSEFWFRKSTYIKDPTGRTPAWFQKKGAKDYVEKKLQKIAYCVHEDDVLKLPPIRELMKSAPMSGMQRRHYEKALHDWELELQTTGLMEIDQVIVQLQKLRQISSGFIYDADGKPIYLRCPKAEMAFDLITDKDYLGLKPKVILWCAHTAELERYGQMFTKANVGHTLFYGKMSRPQREAARFRFRDDKKCKVFVGQVDSGVGMNELIVSDVAMYSSNSLKVVSRQQSMRRNRRKGSEIHDYITYYDLVTEGSVDVGQCKSIKGDMDFAKSILDAVRRGQSLRGALA